MNANMLNRRNVLKGLAAAAVAGPMLPSVAQAAKKGSPKRVIFFMQNQGFDPATAIPAGMKNSGSLAKLKLPEPIQALEPYKERLQIINGLHGTHTSPSRSRLTSARRCEMCSRCPTLMSGCCPGSPCTLHSDALGTPPTL